jgi:hypothetical protein
MATCEPQGSNPSFVGVGFVDAYEATANNVVFGSSRPAAGSTGTSPWPETPATSTSAPSPRSAPALVLAQAGDAVTITVLDVGVQESTRTMQSFTDTRVQLRPAGS